MWDPIMWNIRKEREGRIKTYFDVMRVMFSYVCLPFRIATIDNLYDADT